MAEGRLPDIIDERIHRVEERTVGNGTEWLGACIASAHNLGIPFTVETVAMEPSYEGGHDTIMYRMTLFEAVDERKKEMAVSGNIGD